MNRWSWHVPLSSWHMYTNTNTIHKEKCNKLITNTNCFNVWVALPRYKWEQMLMASPWFEWPQTNWSNYNSAANESSSFSSADVPLYVGMAAVQICKFTSWPAVAELFRVHSSEKWSMLRQFYVRVEARQQQSTQCCKNVSNFVCTSYYGSCKTKTN